MKLRSVLEGCTLRSATGSLDLEILGIAYDSRQVSPSGLFIAIRGTRADGNRFVPQAVQNGAVAIVSSGPPIAGIGSRAVWVEVEDDREALAIASANFHGHPTRALNLIGITGTNGKTTTSYLVESVLRAAGHEAAVLGTIHHRGPGFAEAAERTTPEAPELEQFFRRVADAGWKHAVMEVSSHAIALKRVFALHFDVAVFTNLSRDHLDFHGGMDSYYEAKKKLFTGMGGGMPRVMVLNADDARFDDLRAIAPDRVISYGMQSAADIHPLSYRFGWDGTDSTFRTPAGDLQLRSRLIGTPNLYNAAAAIGVAVGLDIPPEAAIQGIESLPSVPGRFEPVFAGQSFRVLVDYAHTDDALQKLLRSAREITAGRLIVVFGCGGDRDTSKRPLMGQAAAQLSDLAIVTSDNPRSEDPGAIIDEIEAGIQRAGGREGLTYERIVDRRDAIYAALSLAQSGDTVVIAGKGHEAYQTIGTETFSFDDRLVAREVLDELNAERNR